ncbi:MAG: stage II sporulation protein M [Clostridia bacterium]|nr:stage II sporulation protein M [Clostridia bacterium]
MTKVINLRKRNFFKPEITKKSFNKINIVNSEFIKILYLIISVISIFIGCIFFKNHNIEYITELCNKILNSFQYDTYFNVFMLNIKLEFAIYLLLFYIGTSFLGIPLTPIPLMLKSVFIGYFSSFVYCEYEIKGILFLLLLFYPMTMITTTSLIYSTNESLQMSKYIFDCITNKNTADNISIKLYLLRFIILFGISAVSVAANSFIITILAGRFNLH